MFLKTLNALVDAKEETIEKLQGLIETVCQTDSLDRNLQDSVTELNIISEQM